MNIKIPDGHIFLFLAMIFIFTMGLQGCSYETDTNQPPEINNQRIKTDTREAITGKIVFSDPDGDILSVRVKEGASPDGFVLNGATGEYTFDPTSHLAEMGASKTKTLIIRLIVTDARGAATEGQFVIEVQNPNQPPTIARRQSAFVTQEGKISKRIEFSDPDGDKLSISLQEGLSLEGFVLNSATGEYTFDPASYLPEMVINESKTIIIPLIVTDMHGAAAAGELEITIKKINLPPVIESQEVVIYAWDYLRGKIEFSDPEGENVRIENTVPITGFSINAETGEYLFNSRLYLITEKPGWTIGHDVRLSIPLTVVNEKNQSLSGGYIWIRMDTDLNTHIERRIDFMTRFQDTIPMLKTDYNRMGRRVIFDEETQREISAIESIAFKLDFIEDSQSLNSVMQLIKEVFPEFNIPYPEGKTDKINYQETNNSGHTLTFQFHAYYEKHKAILNRLVYDYTIRLKTAKTDTTIVIYQKDFQDKVNVNIQQLTSVIQINENLKVSRYFKHPRYTRMMDWDYYIEHYYRKKDEDKLPYEYKKLPDGYFRVTHPELRHTYFSEFFLDYNYIHSTPLSLYFSDQKQYVRDLTNFEYLADEVFHRGKFPGNILPDGIDRIDLFFSEFTEYVDKHHRHVIYENGHFDDTNIDDPFEALHWMELHDRKLTYTHIPHHVLDDVEDENVYYTLPGRKEQHVIIPSKYGFMTLGLKTIEKVRQHISKDFPSLDNYRDDILQYLKKFSDDEKTTVYEFWNKGDEGKRSGTLILVGDEAIFSGFIKDETPNSKEVFFTEDVKNYTFMRNIYGRNYKLQYTDEYSYGAYGTVKELSVHTDTGAMLRARARIPATLTVTGKNDHWDNDIISFFRNPEINDILHWHFDKITYYDADGREVFSDFGDPHQEYKGDIDRRTLRIEYWNEDGDRTLISKDFDGVIPYEH